MAYNFKITFPGNQRATLFAMTKPESDDMERALIALKADYVIQGPKWIGGSFQMTPAAYEALARLAPVQTSPAVSLGDVPRKFPLDSRKGIVGVDCDSIAQPNCV
jgi:hypothetical protein